MCGTPLTITWFDHKLLDLPAFLLRRKLSVDLVYRGFGGWLYTTELIRSVVRIFTADQSTTEQGISRYVDWRYSNRLLMGFDAELGTT